MDCEKVREQFSAMFEGELGTAEEKEIRKHLDSCSDCQKEWEEFNRMMGWLHAVEDEEVPERFFSEIQKKREERKDKHVRTEAWFLRSAKIPIQAAAMVMIVFLALYLTGMPPFDLHRKEDVKKPEVQQREIAQKEHAPPTALHQKGDVSEPQPSVSDLPVSGKDRILPQMKKDEKKPPGPSFKEEAVVTESARPKEMVTAAPPPLEEKRKEQDTAGRAKMPLAKKVAHEMTLKINERESAFLQVEGLAKQLGGEVVREDGDVLVASLPASSFGSFEKGLARVGSISVASKSAVQQDVKDDLRSTSEIKSRGIEEKIPSRPISSREDTISVRIRLIPE